LLERVHAGVHHQRDHPTRSRAVVQSAEGRTKSAAVDIHGQGCRSTSRRPDNRSARPIIVIEVPRLTGTEQNDGIIPRSQTSPTRGGSHRDTAAANGQGIPITVNRAGTRVIEGQ